MTETSTEKYQSDERAVSSREIPLGDGSALVLPNDGVPTQVANPTRAGWRTFVQAIVPTLLVINGALLALQAVLSSPEYSGYVPTWAWAAVNGGLLISAFLSKAIAQVMAAPGVNEWIKNHLPALAAIPLRKYEPKH